MMILFGYVLNILLVDVEIGQMWGYLCVFDLMYEFDKLIVVIVLINDLMVVMCNVDDFVCIGVWLLNLFE